LGLRWLETSNMVPTNCEIPSYICFVFCIKFIVKELTLECYNYKQYSFVIVSKFIVKEQSFIELKVYIVDDRRIERIHNLQNRV